MMALFMTIGMNAQSLKGNWTYQIAEAPYGYESGTVSFVEKGKQCVADISVNYEKVTVNLTQNKNVFRTSFSVDGSHVEVELIPQKNGQIKASLKIDGTSMNIKLTEKKKK